MDPSTLALSTQAVHILGHLVYGIAGRGWTVERARKRVADAEGAPASGAPSIPASCCSHHHHAVDSNLRALIATLDTGLADVVPTSRRGEVGDALRRMRAECTYPA